LEGIKIGDPMVESNGNLSTLEDLDQTAVSVHDNCNQDPELQQDVGEMGMMKLSQNVEENDDHDADRSDFQQIVERDIAVLDINSTQDEEGIPIIQPSVSYESRVNNDKDDGSDSNDCVQRPLFEEKSGTFVYNYGPDNLPGLTAWKLVRLPTCLDWKFVNKHISGNYCRWLAKLGY
jgi:hypothetical protein